MESINEQSSLENSNDHFNVVMRTITQRIRHNGAFFFAKDLLIQESSELEEFRATEITRPEGTLALLFHQKQHKFPPLLKHRCKEAHLTFDDNIRKGEALFSPGHFRGLFYYNSKLLKVGVYFNEQGEKIHLTVSILSHQDQKKILLENDPLFLEINREITPHYLPFQRLFSTIMKLKHQDLERLNLDITAQDIQLSKLIDESNFDAPRRAMLTQDIQAFILNVKKANSYNDKMQDLRYQQYEKLLYVIHQLVDHSIRPSLIYSNIDEPEPHIVIEHSSNNKTQTMTSLSRHDVYAAEKENIKAQVDAILSILNEQHMLDVPKHEQFIHVMTPLKQLELDCWSILFNADVQDSVFIKEQKERLGFIALSLDVYFSMAIEMGDQSAVKTLLPHITLSRKISHFQYLFNNLENAKEPHVLLLCDIARFLYREDPDFKTFLLLKQMSFSNGIINNTLAYQSLLMIFFAKNNIEGFRLLLENNPTLETPQVIIQDQQYSILNACIYYNSPNTIHFIRALFEHGVQVSHHLNILPKASLEQIEIESNKIIRQTRTPTNNKLKVLKSTSQEETQDSLQYAIQRESDLQIIQIIAEHASLKVLLMNLSQCLCNEIFALRICNTSNPIIGCMDNTMSLDKIIDNYPYTKGNISIALLFYKFDTTPITPKMSILFSIIDMLIATILKISDETTDEDKRKLITIFINKAKEEQKTTTTEKNALISTHAGLLMWTQIADPTFDDYKLVLQLFYLRSEICCKIYRRNTDIDHLKLITLTVATTLIDNLPNELSRPLQQLKFYEMLCNQMELCKDHLITRHGAGFFAPSQQNRATTLIISENSLQAYEPECSI